MFGTSSFSSFCPCSWQITGVNIRERSLFYSNSSNFLVFIPITKKASLMLRTIREKMGDVSVLHFVGCASRYNLPYCFFA
jgi:hypothetical protein